MPDDFKNVARGSAVALLSKVDVITTVETLADIAVGIDKRRIILIIRKCIVSIVLVDKIDDDFDHCVLFFGAAFGNHQG